MMDSDTRVWIQASCACLTLCAHRLQTASAGHAYKLLIHGILQSPSSHERICLQLTMPWATPAHMPPTKDPPIARIASRYPAIGDWRLAIGHRDRREVLAMELVTLVMVLCIRVPHLTRS
jgi:hypothetical protein